MKSRGQSQYISWILIVAMVMMISFILYNWTIERAKKTEEQIRLISDPGVCSEVDVLIEGICQNFRSIQLNATNKGRLEIKGFQLRGVGLYQDEADYLSSRTILVNIFPMDRERVSALSISTQSQIKIIPFVSRDGKYVYCEEKAIVVEKEGLKQC